MDAKYARFTLKFLIWTLYIIGGALGLASAFSAWRGDGIDIWTILSIPMSFVYVVGGLYVISHFDNVIKKHAKTLIKALVGLFAVDMLYFVTMALGAFYRPDSFIPPLTATPKEFLTASAVGIGFAVLILLVMTRLVNMVSGRAPKMPPKWMTTAAWALIAAMVFGVVLYALGE